MVIQFVTAAPWEGPFNITEKISEVTYRIWRGPRGKSKVVHVDRLWRNYGPGRFTWGTAEPKDYSSPEMSDEEEVSGHVAEATQYG